MAAPIAPKALAGGVTAAASGAVLWVLSTYVFKGNVPDGVASMVYVFMPGLLAFAAAYLAPHQVRPGDTPAVVTAPASGTAPVVLTEATMDAIRAALALPQTAADERKVTPTL
jgi:hypothetical protein